jgi:hypothetical protein
MQSWAGLQKSFENQQQAADFSADFSDMLLAFNGEVPRFCRFLLDL